MAAMPETVTMQVRLLGADEVKAQLLAIPEALTEHRDRLIQMGWSVAMAEQFLGEVADVVVRRCIKVEPAPEAIEVSRTIKAALASIEQQQAEAMRDIEKDVAAARVGTVQHIEDLIAETRAVSKEVKRLRR